MKTFLKSLLLFLPFIAVIYISLLMIWAKVVPNSYQKNMLTVHGHVKKRLDEAKKTENVDVLFLGSSHTFQGFDTRIFKKAGLNTFNLGSPSQTPLQTEYLLGKYLDSLKPKLVVYEVYPVTFSLDGVEASLHLVANEEVNSEIFNMTLEQNSLMVYNTIILSFLEQVLNLEIKKERIRKTEKYVSGGYLERRMKYFDKTPRPRQALKFDEELFKMFEKNIQHLKKRNIKYILVQAPFPKVSYNAITNLDGFDKRMNRYGRYYNFNEYMNLDDSLHYLDDSHLNQHGVEAFNKQLIDTLEERKHLLSIKL